jgi:hypothetical protein
MAWHTVGLDSHQTSEIKMETTRHAIAGAPEIAAKITLRMDMDGYLTWFGYLPAGAERAGRFQPGALFRCLGQVVFVK